MAKREPHWVKLFIRELSQAGNVRLAAERAGVDFTTAYGRRKRHAEFADRWEGALAAHRNAAPDPSTISSSDERVHHAPGMAARAHSRSPGKLSEEFSVRPDGKGIKSSEARGGKRAEERFLTELPLSANVRRAAAAAGFSPVAVYKSGLRT